MQRLFTASSLALAALAGFVERPSNARACSPESCKAASVVPASGSVPANSVEFYWRPPRSFVPDAGAAPLPRLFVASADGGVGSEIPLAFTWRDPTSALVRSMRPLSAGESIVFQYQESCSPTPASSKSAALRIAENASRPTSLGTLRVAIKRERLPVWVVTGECIRALDASIAELSVDFAPEVAPYWDSLRFGVRLDGKPELTGHADFLNSWKYFSGFSGRAPERGTEVVFALCEPNPSAPSGTWPGEHRVRMVATLPDGTEITSDELRFNLDCANSADAGVDGGAGPSPTDAQVVQRLDATTSSAPREAGTTDSAVSSPSKIADAAAAPDDTESTPDDEDGCSIRPSQHERESSLVHLFALLALTFGARRYLAKRRQRTSCVAGSAASSTRDPSTSPGSVGHRTARADEAVACAPM